jgi:hypothetical protein
MSWVLLSANLSMMESLPSVLCGDAVGTKVKAKYVQRQKRWVSHARHHGLPQGQAFTRDDSVIPPEIRRARVVSRYGDAC